MHCDLLKYFDWDTPILPKFVMQFWFKVELHSEGLTSKVISKEVKVNITTIATAIGCEIYNNSFYDR